MSKKLTTHEVTDSRLLMIMISARDPTGATARRIAESVKADGPDVPVYDVRVSINGVELDFRDYAAEVERQLDDMVMREAGELIKRTIGDQLDGLLHDARESLEFLADGIRKKAAETLGFNPWQDTDG